MQIDINYDFISLTENFIWATHYLSLARQMEGNPIPNIKIISHYKQITKNVNVIFIILIIILMIEANLCPQILF